MHYLPPFEAIKTLVSFADADGQLTVSASYMRLLLLIRALLQGVPVDEAWYLERYPDVAKAIADGGVLSAREHFLNDGYFEGRMPWPIQVNEAWYLEQNPGVAEHVQRGEMASGQEHFDRHGYAEGRRPFPP